MKRERKVQGAKEGEGEGQMEDKMEAEGKLSECRKKMMV